jgi:hypothetical protein
MDAGVYGVIAIAVVLVAYLLYSARTQRGLREMSNKSREVGERNTLAVEANTAAIRELIAKLDQAKNST